jgi:hypothetical protein
MQPANALDATTNWVVNLLNWFTTVFEDGLRLASNENPKAMTTI